MICRAIGVDYKFQNNDEGASPTTINISSRDVLLPKVNVSNNNIVVLVNLSSSGLKREPCIN